jgi:hypothetical protein
MRGEMNMRYHQIQMNDKIFYREFDEATGFYTNTKLSEESLVKQLLENSVDSRINIDRELIHSAILTIQSSRDREQVLQYLIYLETIVESLEKEHRIEEKI